MRFYYKHLQAVVPGVIAIVFPQVSWRIVEGLWLW